MPVEIILPADTEFVPVADVPELIANALHPDISGQPDTAAYFVKIARPGAIGETAKWNGWPIDDDDRKVMEDICGEAPPVGATAEQVEQYLERANSTELDWELAVCWKNPELNSDILRYSTAREHRQAVISAIRLGKLQVLNPSTRLPADEYQASAVVTLDSLIGYLNAFHIGVRLAARSIQKASPISGNAGDWKERARAIADELFDYDTGLNTRDQLGKRNTNGEVIGGYAYRVMEEMQKRNIHGPRGRIDNAATIMREALQGKKWWSNKPK